MSLVGVIVPVYKTEKFLSRCVTSILSQTYRNIILILVDDGSPDNCPAICDEYASEDGRVHVIHQENNGPSKARNSGIEWVLHCTNCEYLVFIDSDDCIHPQYLELLYFGISKNKTDISMCTHRYISLNESIGKTKTYSDVSFICANAEDLMLEHNSFNYIWGKMFSVDCFRDIRFPENISFGEDSLILYKILFACERISFTDEPLYYYFYNPNSITKSVWTPKALQCFDGINAQLTFYKNNGFLRAFRKEIELYIQQCAYQIHRIREDREHLQMNQTYITNLRKDMIQCLRENSDFSVYDNFYWYEALYPFWAGVKQQLLRLSNSIKKHGIRFTLRKIWRKLRKT